MFDILGRWLAAWISVEASAPSPSAWLAAVATHRL